MMLPLAITILQHVLIGLFIIISLMLILVVLIQKGKGGGVGAAFGGMGGASSLLGTKTGDFLTWVTISIVALFLVISVVMGISMKPQAPSVPAQAAPMNRQMPTKETQQPAPAAGQEETTPEAETKPLEDAAQSSQDTADNMEEAAQQMTTDVAGANEKILNESQQPAEQARQPETPEETNP